MESDWPAEGQKTSEEQKQEMTLCVIFIS